MGWLEDWGLVGSKGSATPVWVPEVNDFRVPITDAQGNPNYRMPNQADRNKDGGAYTRDEARAREAKEERKRDQQQIIQIGKQDRAAERTERAADRSLQEQQNQGILEGIRNQGVASRNSHELGLAQLSANTAETRASRLSNERENAANREYQRERDGKEDNRFNRNMELNNELLRQRLGMEDRHFERQVALDERNARRTKVLGALTLIAQSLQRL